MSEDVIRKLVDRRNELGWSQGDVAARMGTSQSAVARFEVGATEPRVSTVLRYAAAVGMTLDLPGLDGEVLSPPAPKGHAAIWPRSAPVLEAGESGEPDPTHILTWRQRKILAYLKDYVEEHGYVPSVRDIGEAVGLVSTSSVTYQIGILTRKGFIQKIPNQPRAMVVRMPRGQEAAEVMAVQPTVFVPLVTHVPEGSLTEQAVRDVYPLPRLLVGDGDLLLFRFSGHDMIPARVLDGDLVAVRRDAEVHDGDLVGATVNGVFTVRILRCAGDQLWLMSYNLHTGPVQAERDDIAGPVVSVMRQLLRAATAHYYALRGDGFEPSLAGRFRFSKKIMAGGWTGAVAPVHQVRTVRVEPE